MIRIEDLELTQERFAHRPLVGAMLRVQGLMAEFRERVRAYYFEVVLSPHQCTACGGRLKMTGQSLCSCSCGKTFEPTLEFQRSGCCGARLLRKKALEIARERVELRRKAQKMGQIEIHRRKTDT